MRGSFFGLGVLSCSLVLGSLATGCSSSGSAFSGDGGTGPGLDGTTGGGDGGIGGGGRDSGTTHLGGGSTDAGADAGFGADAFFAMDPPLMYCGFDGGATPPVPGGTPMCPSDKNREGCPCPTEGMTAACWPGLRVDRDIGICKDGTTTCQTVGEGLTQVWGPCMGYVLPEQGATAGADACKCFSTGQWAITNLSPCLYEEGSGTIYAAAAVLTGSTLSCPSMTDPPTPPAIWSTDTLKVDCEGQFKLCFTIKAGNAASPQASDCTVGQACVSGDYTMANAVQTFPPLPGWVGTDTACAAQFNATGGYGQMTVQGVSEYCEPIGADDGGAPMVFNTVAYCGPDAGADCQSGGSGSFGQ